MCFSFHSNIVFKSQMTEFRHVLVLVKVLLRGYRSMAILEDRQSGYIHIIYHTFKLRPSVVVVVPQGI